jgi:putative component of toxin-antitoxin plasmid stabilization module
MIQVLRYQREDGSEPFTEWLNGLRDFKAQARIRVRLNHLALGNFGDCESVAKAFSNCASMSEPGIASIVRGMARASCCCSRAAISRANRRTSYGRRTCGRTGSGGSDEKVKGVAFPS